MRPNPRFRLPPGRDPHPGPHVVEAGQGLAVLAPPVQQRALAHEAREGAGRRGALRHGGLSRRLATAARQRRHFRRRAKSPPTS